MSNILSYRVGDPRQPIIPLERVKALGIPCVEINFGEDVAAAEIKTVLDEGGVSAGSVTIPCSLELDGLETTVEAYAGKAAVLGAKVLFASVQPGELPQEDIIARLRRLGDAAAAHGVLIGMETHPPLCENGSKASEIAVAINHPNVGINYDTANVYYYNEGVNTVEEVAKTADHIVSVHLKDTMGGFHDGSFPVFGLGIVDFPGVFNVLNGIGFEGPFTMELEGPMLASDDPAVREQHVAGCVEHLRGLGLVP